MTIEKINPDTLYDSIQFGFTHAVKSTSAATIHCSGQVAWDIDGNLVGGDDVGAQARQALANLKLVLKAAGSGISDIIRIRTYVVNHNPSLMEPIGRELAAFFGEFTPAANTWIGVQSLALPGLLIEVEATAEVPN